MSKIVQIAVSPRKTSTTKPFDCVYVLTAEGQVFRCDLYQGGERTVVWDRLPDLPAEAHQLPDRGEIA